MERAFRRRSVWSGRVTDAPRPRPDYRESKNLPGVQRIRRIAVPRDDESIILPVSQRWFPGRLEDGPRSLWLILGPLESGRERGEGHFTSASIERVGLTGQERGTKQLRLLSLRRPSAGFLGRFYFLAMDGGRKNLPLPLLLAEQ